MPQQIEFRGKKLNGPGWAFGSHLQREDGKHFIYQDRNWFEVDPETVGQLHEELTRQIGKKVYQGDKIVHDLREGLGEPYKSNLKGEVDIYGFYYWYTKIRLTKSLHE